MQDGGFGLYATVQARTSTIRQLMAMRLSTQWAGRVYTLLALLVGLSRILIVDGGTLSAVSVSSNTLVAGAQGVKWTFSLTLENALPPDGAIDITTPSTYSITRGYWPSTALTPLTGNLDGSFTIHASSATALRISRWGGSQVSGPAHKVQSVFS